MYKATRTIAAEGTTITNSFHNLRRIPRRLVPHYGNLNPTYVSSGSCVTSIAGPNGVRNCTRDEGTPFEVGNQVLISSHRKLLLSKAMVVNVAEKSGLDSDRQG
jgi:hypothetical protein